MIELQQAQASLHAGAQGPAVPVTLPHDWQDSFPGHSGVVSYRLQLPVPTDRGLLGVYIPRVCSNVEVFLNGELIGSGGRMHEPVTRNCYHPQLFSLPHALLRTQGNELRLEVAGFATREVAARQRAAGLSAVLVGPMQELQPQYMRQLFWNVTVAQIIAATIGMLGAAILGLAAVRRKDTYLLYFGLFTVGWALIGTRLFVRVVPLDNWLTEVLICSSFAPVLACAYLFLLRLVEERHAWLDRLLWFQALLVPVALLLVGHNHMLRAASVVYNVLAVEFVLCVTVFCITAWKHYRREFWLMSGVLALAVLLAAIEIALQNDWLPLPRVHVIHFAMPLVFTVIGIRLIQMFVHALGVAETVNEQLERRVAQKSSEIEHGYAELAALREREAARQERYRIAADLHDDLGARLLAIAQTAPSDAVASMAREALDEMRLSVRGMTGEAARAIDVLADWRAETVSRLAAAGFEADWDAQEPSRRLILPSRTHVQLTRVLREAVSNVIRHSGGRRCHVRVAFEPPGLCLTIEDDGQGLPAGPRPATGHGLPNIERRVRKLEGTQVFSTSALGGARLQVCVPLETTPSSANMPSHELRPDR